MKTNYDRVTEFNECMGLCEPNRPPGTTSKAQRLLRNSLIKEEAIIERAEAQEAEDLVKIMDAHGDSLVVMYGEANDYKFDSDIILAIVNHANMSKVCTTEDEARDSVIAYGKGTHPDKPGVKIETHWEVVTVNGKDRFAVHDSKTGKGLKSINFQPPEKHLRMYASLLTGKCPTVLATLKRVLVTNGDVAMIAYLTEVCDNLTNQ